MVHPTRARAIVGLLTLQAGLLAYSGARAARAFMEQAPPAGDTRLFGSAVDASEATPGVPGSVVSAPSAAGSPLLAATASGRELLFQEIVDPWQPGRPASRSAELVDPWRESQPLDIDPELIDPWRNERSIASVTRPSAAFDWDTSLPELLNPWPIAVDPLEYPLNELVDPWSKL